MNTKWVALGVLAAGLGMIVLDGTIVGVAMPVIIADLKLSLADAQWVSALYSVVFAALLLAFGRAGDSWGRKNIFAWGIAIFAVSSVMAALSTGAGMLIWARALQGVGGAMVLPSSLSSVNAAFRGAERAVAFGVWGAVMAGVAAVGPLLGGLICKHWQWQGIFWVNVPVGILLLVLTRRFVPNSRGQRGHFDALGVVLSALSFGSIVFGIIEGPVVGWLRPKAPLRVGNWVFPEDAALSVSFLALCGGLVFLILFVTSQVLASRRGGAPLVAPEMFRFRTFSWGNMTALAVAAGEFALIFVLPLYLLAVAGLDTMGAGWVLAAMAVGAFVSGALARHLSAMIGAAGTVILGLVLEFVGVLGLTFDLHLGSSVIAAILAIYGLGLGLASAQLTSTVLRDIPPALSGQGAATQSTFRQLGSALGTALGGTVLAARLQADVMAQLAKLHLPAAKAEGLTKMVVDSVGGGIAGMPSSPIRDALQSGFQAATTASLYLALVFIGVGVMGAMRVAKVAKSEVVPKV
ncbi:MAG: MFS transporter [Actinomycetaceae bacterium]|nr:MFS transporter [Actinomycetaceae bacterium]